MSQLFRGRTPRPLRASTQESGVMKLDRKHYDTLQEFTYEDLKLFTEGFSDKNKIGRSQFCQVYRGLIPHGWNSAQEKQRDVTVKIWADTLHYKLLINKTIHLNPPANFLRFMDEVTLLNDPVLSNHPNLVKLMGWCLEDDTVAVVYDLNSYDTLRNLVAVGTLKWTDRVKITLGLASLLKALHNSQPRYLVLNLSAAHIMLDQDYNFVLFEFGMLSTEVPTDFICFPYGAFGYEDQLVSLGWGDHADIFAFGVILMELLCKCTVDGHEKFKLEKPYYLHSDCDNLYRSLKKADGVSSVNLVEKSLMEDAAFDNHDGVLLSMIAVECAQFTDDRQCFMEIVSRLKNLNFICNLA